jgi:hypothetical protein
MQVISPTVFFSDDITGCQAINSPSDCLLLQFDVDCVHESVRQILWSLTLVKLEFFRLPGKRMF